MNIREFMDRMEQKKLASERAESGPGALISVRCSPELRASLHYIAGLERRSVSNLVKLMLEDAVKERFQEEWLEDPVFIDMVQDEYFELEERKKKRAEKWKKEKK